MYNNKLLKVIKTKAGIVHIYENIVLGEVADGITLSVKDELSILLRISNLLGANPWVYIYNRKNSYSVNPTEYRYLNKISVLKGIAIVNYNNDNETSQLEAAFCKKPFAVFEDLDSAFIWANEIINN